MTLSKYVGNTPLIKISDRIYAKAELMNPTGSIKDRAASYIINLAEKMGDLRPGDTIIEATSGNMGISLAWLASERGYNCKIVMPSNMSEERKQTLRMYGAELIEVADGNFDEAIRLRDELSEKHGYFNANQFGNPLSIEVHFEKTGTEILTQHPNHIGAFVDGTGTGGTLMGVSRLLKMYHPNIKVIAVEPAESPVMSGGQPGLHGILGIGDGSKFLVDLNEVDDIMVISTKDATDRAKRLCKELGLFVGISSGANVLASERLLEKYPDIEGNILTILCDRGDRYMSLFM